MTVGERIKQKRIELGWSQQDLAKRAGYSDKTAVSKIEHSGNEITLKQVKRIAKAMNVDPSEFMGWQDLSIPAFNTSDIVDIKNMFTYTKETHPPHFVGDRKEAAARKLYELYQKASPEIQQAVDLLLKVDKQP